jgi:iron(III) transport system permease protein
MAYVYTDFLQFVGPVQTTLREIFGWEHGDYHFPDIRTLPGAILMFVFVLYPYVYLLARTAFLERAGGVLEAARTLGTGPWRAFFTVSLPLARPAIAAGVALALMETLADYGTVAYFAVNTFTTGIYRAWFSLGDRVASAQLAAILLGFVLLLVALERSTRGRARYHNTSSRHRPPPGRLHGLAGCGDAGLLHAAAAGLPAARRAAAADGGWRRRRPVRRALPDAGPQQPDPLRAHRPPRRRPRGAAGLQRPALEDAARPGLNRLVGLGYAVPGTVIAVGVLIPVTRLDNWLAGQWESAFGSNPGLLLTGGIAALIYAYLARFLAVALQTVDASLSKITPSMDDAARSLGLGQGATLRRVHVPILRGSLFTAACWFSWT